MIYILDTCVISELYRTPPHEAVAVWVRNADETSLFLSVLTIGEIKRGIESLPPSTRKERIQAFLDHQLIQRFAGRIIPLDSEVMLTWGTMYARLSKIGRPLPVIDSLIAATGLHHHAVIVTRNTNDFIVAGVEVINPWGTSSAE
jgi:predicted nucleic acid-binding protein